MFDKLKTFFSQFKIYVAVALVILSFVAGGYVVYKLKQPVIDKLKLETQVFRDANLVSTATISALKSDVTKAHTQCKEQIDRQARTQRKLKQIDEAGGKANVQVPNNGGSGDASGGTLLDLGNRVFDRPGY